MIKIADAQLVLASGQWYVTEVDADNPPDFLTKVETVYSVMTDRHIVKRVRFNRDRENERYGYCYKEEVTDGNGN